MKPFETFRVKANLNEYKNYFLLIYSVFHSEYFTMYSEVISKKKKEGESA